MDLINSIKFNKCLSQFIEFITFMKVTHEGCAHSADPFFPHLQPAAQDVGRQGCLSCRWVLLYYDSSIGIPLPSADVDKS